MQELINLALIVAVATIFGGIISGLIFKNSWERIIGDSITRVFAIAFFTIVLIVTGTYPQ